MKINIFSTKKETSKKAAEKAKNLLNNIIKEKGEVTFVMATGNSQLDFISELVSMDDIDWSKTTMYHLDEYIGISRKHRASFRKYLNERFISKVDNLGEINLINGNNDDPQAECSRLNKKIKRESTDIAFIGIGENGHIAFNDPPADFDTTEPFIIAELDEKCRQQQVNEGWYDSLDEVPEKAITMSVQQIIDFDHVICTVPGKRKAQAVKDCFGDWKVSPQYPASILKIHDNVYTYLDDDSACLIK